MEPTFKQIRVRDVMINYLISVDLRLQASIKYWAGVFTMPGSLVKKNNFSKLSKFSKLRFATLALTQSIKFGTVQKKMYLNYVVVANLTAYYVMISWFPNALQVIL